MMPLYKAQSLTGDMLLSPFEIFIYLPEKELSVLEERLKKTWEELDIVSSVFNLKFISAENLIDGDPYLERVFKKSNIFARILMPRTGDKIGIEIGWINLYSMQEAWLKGDLLRFVYQLCEKGLEQVEQVMIDTQFFVPESWEQNERLDYLAELENRLIEIKKNIIWQDGAQLRMFLADKHRYQIKVNPDYLADDFEANKQKLGNRNFDSISIQELAALVGFDVPNFENGTADNPASLFYEPSVSITVKQLIPGAAFPGLRIGIGTQYVNVPTRSREGIFAYVCTLIQYINGRSFGKEDINKFLKELKKHSTYKVLSQEDPEDPFELLEKTNGKSNREKTNKVRNFDRGVILFDKMPPLLSRVYFWFKKIYDALFRIGRSLDHAGGRRYHGNMNFEQWCIHVLYDDIKEPFRQAISNERSDIRTKLTEQGYGAIVNQVGLLNRDKKFYINVDPNNIHFPKDELWEEALNYAGEMNPDLRE